MQHAESIASFGYLSGNPALLGYIISYFIEEVIVDVDDGQVYYGQSVAGGGGGSPILRRKLKKITINFKYEKDIYTETKYVESNIEVSMINMEVSVVDGLPTVIFKNLELKNGNINLL